MTTVTLLGQRVDPTHNAPYERISMVLRYIAIAWQWWNVLWSPWFDRTEVSLEGHWKVLDWRAPLTRRHEACFVLLEETAYLIGGRGRLPVDIFHPRNGTWTKGTGPPIELHHMQCVPVPQEHSIFIVSSWTGPYPRERNTEFIYIYHVRNDTWSTRAGMPEPRRRGGAAAVLVPESRIYVSHGNRGGHETANFSTSLAWLDYYDLATDTWVTGVLPDAPHPRDHTGGAFLPGTNQLCVAGGRDGGALDFFDQVILPTDCFDLTTETWTVAPDLPQGRAGSAYGTTCNGQYMIVAGGEGFGKAWDNVDVFNGQVWRSWDSLNIGRHGTGLAIDCAAEYRDQIYIASGAASQGGSLEVRSVEIYLPNRTAGTP